MRYVCLIYFDPKQVFDGSPEAEAVLAELRPHAAELKASGHLVMGHDCSAHLAHAARADLQRRLGQHAAARASYERALALTQQPAERRFLEARLAALTIN